MLPEGHNQCRRLSSCILGYVDDVIGYTKQDFTKGTSTFDLIFDNVGAQSLKDMRRVLTPSGRLLANGAPAPTGWFGGLGHPIKAMFASLVSKQQGRPFLSMENSDDLKTLRGLAEAGSIVPVIDSTFSMDDGIAAISYVGQGHNQGTSTITM